MMPIEMTPAISFFIAAALIALTRGTVRHIITLVMPLLALAHIWTLPTDIQVQFDFLSYTITLVQINTYSIIFATVFTLAAFAGGLFALNQKRPQELSAAFLYAGSAIGVVFAGDLISFFIFWEIMTIGSTLVIWSADTDKARAAGLRYALLHFVGGVILMIGITAHVYATNSIALPHFVVNDFSALFDGELSGVAMWLILVGVLINAGAPPFSSWLSDAYPEASPSGAVFLSAFTTKTAVFVLLSLFYGSQILIYVGLFMIFYGIVYAILENDMRRILVYSIINQVGFMITGIGIGTELSMNGAAAHAFSHIIYKALLLMSAGSVLFMTNKRKFSDLGGLYHSMKLTCIFGIIGALAISSFPLTSGFISKPMISDAAAQEHLAIVWFMLTAASAAVFLYVGLKFPWFVFFQKDSGLRPKDPPLNMLLAMGLVAVICIAPGIYPDPIYAMLSGDVTYEPNTALHFVTQLQLLLFSGLVFFLMQPLLKRTLTISLEFDWFYRVLMNKGLLGLEKLGNAILSILAKMTFWILDLSIAKIASVSRPNGGLSKILPVGTTTLWVSVLLVIYLFLYYFSDFIIASH